MIRLENAAVLEAIFALQGDFAQGITSPEKKFAGGIEVAPFRDHADAACCISTDFEMGWGWRSRGVQGAEFMGETERRNVPLILGMLEKYSIPITWATVGHLFLESCSRSSTGLAHATMPRPLMDGSWSGDWYAHDPCSNVRQSPSWYAPDLIQQIIDSKVQHEIGSHSFSHINFSALYSSPELVQREMESCVESMRPFGLTLRSLVFPRNRAEYSYLPQLADAGIVVVRHRERVNHIRLSYPERTASGVYKIYESMNLRIARRYNYLQKVKIFLRKARARHAVYSLWFHPSDPAEWFDPQLRDILECIDGERRTGRLWVATMRDIAAYCEARERAEISTERGESSLTLSIRTSLDTSRYGTPEISLLIPIPSQPRSVSLELAGGERRQVTGQTRSAGSLRLMVTIPATAARLELTF